MIDNLIKQLRTGFGQVKDTRSSNKSYKLDDILSVGFAIFSLKDPSLACFREQYEVRSENLRRVYGIESVPGDSALRESLDEVEPKELEQLFNIPIAVLQEEKVLEQRRVLGKYTAISVDGTGHYCSGKKSCPHCMVKNHRNGSQSFYHQLLGAVAVHPDQSTVFPIACQAIVNKDGATKNDCELNASKRIIPQIRKALPEELIIAIFDALYINGPHIKALGEANMRYIIGAKGQNYVQVQVERMHKSKQLQQLQWEEAGKICTIHFTNNLVLNGQHQDILTNYFQYSEVETTSGKTIFYSDWITDIPIHSDNAQELVRVARARWKIENETFNTLKNQGYHLEHNYGHGKKNLATNFALLTFLAFLVDQIAQHLDKTFQEAKTVCKSFKAFWERVRAIFYLLPVLSMNAIYKFILKRQQVLIQTLI